MKPLRITIVLPFPMLKPVGRAMNMYEYANRFRERGHEVVVLHSTRHPFEPSGLSAWFKYLSYRIRRVARPNWFVLHKAVKSLIVPSITDVHVPNADIIFSTWWQMAYAISELSPAKGKPFNIIQYYETWDGHEERVHESYSLPVNHMVVSKYLEDIVMKHSGRKPLFVPSAVDTGRFFIRLPFYSRKPASILMLYSPELRRGTKYGIEALTKLRELVPSVTVSLFGVVEKPDLPPWMHYHYKPANLPELYNQHAIFFSPSLSEGWGLPPAEAMASGCALVCTAIGGHPYAIDNETALTVTPKAVGEMTQKLKMLVDDDNLRITLAKSGHDYLLKHFTFDVVIARLEEYFYDSLK